MNKSSINDIENIDDIKVFIDAFYEKIREDDLLGPLFALRIVSDAWDKHLNRMYDFWNTILFFQKNYKGNPFSKHACLPIDSTHFDRWIYLFKLTIDDNFEGEVADKINDKAEKMAMMFTMKLEYLKAHPNYKSIV